RGRSQPVQRPRAPGVAPELQRRPADRRPVQAGDPGDHQPPERRQRAVEAAHRLHERSHVRLERRHAARRRQGVPPDAAKRRGVRRAARAASRAGRLLQSGVGFGRIGAKVSAVVLDALTQVERFVNVFVTVYTLAILIYILTTWVKVPYSLRPVQRFFYDVCDPYLRLWRRLIPVSLGPIDLTPMIGVLALVAFDRIVIAVLERLH